MPRHRKARCCRTLRDSLLYKPAGIPFRELEQYEIELDEFEAMRLCDLEGLQQDQAGERMGVSRGTVQRLLKSGREKIMSALLSSAAIMIRNQDREHCCKEPCKKEDT